MHGDPVGRRLQISNTSWPASTLQPVCSPATTSTETSIPPVRSRWSLRSAVRTTPSDTIRDRSPSGSPWQCLLHSQVGLEPKDYGSTSSWALLLLFTSPPPNRAALLTAASSRRKQAHLIGSQTERKLRNQHYFPVSQPRRLLRTSQLRSNGRAQTKWTIST